MQVNDDYYVQERGEQEDENEMMGDEDLQEKFKKQEWNKMSSRTTTTGAKAVVAIT